MTAMLSDCNEVLFLCFMDKESEGRHGGESFTQAVLAEDFKQGSICTLQTLSANTLTNPRSEVQCQNQPLVYMSCFDLRGFPLQTQISLKLLKEY